MISPVKLILSSTPIAPGWKRVTTPRNGHSVGVIGVGLYKYLKSRLVRERCDVLVSLPMRGRVGSLNASASLAAALYGYVLPSRPT